MTLQARDWRKCGYLFLRVAVLAMAGFAGHPAHAWQPASTSTEQPDPQHLVGRWVRPDGGDLLKVREVGKDGKMKAGGLFEMTGRNVTVPGDTFSRWTDARTRHTRKIQVSNNYKGDAANVAATFQTLASGLTYMAYAEIAVPTMQLSVQAQNFNYTRPNRS